MFLFSSTAAVYGNADVSPIPESAPLRPSLPVRRLEAGLRAPACTARRAAPGFRSAALRYFNASGAHPDWHVGEEHDPEEHLIPRVIAALLDGRPVEVYGNDYPTPDGTCVRDYVHVTDLAEAHVRVLEADAMPSGVSLQLRHGRRAARCCRSSRRSGLALKIRPSLAMKPRRSGDPASLVADPSQLVLARGLAPGAFGAARDRGHGRGLGALAARAPRGEVSMAWRCCKATRSTAAGRTSATARRD